MRSRRARQVRGGKETVLVVEDEAVLRELVREIFEAHGYEVLEAGRRRGRRCTCGRSTADEVDLLLTDVCHARRHVRAASWRRSCARRAPLPVIFSSGYSQEMMESNEDSRARAPFISPSRTDQPNWPRPCARRWMPPRSAIPPWPRRLHKHCPPAMNPEEQNAKIGRFPR